MIEDKEQEKDTAPSPQSEPNEEMIVVKNPFNKDDIREITKDEMENEELYKEATTERD